MADHQQQGNEAKGYGMFDFLKKKKDEEKSQDAIIANTEVKEENPTFVEKLQLSHSNSSSSSEEEVEGEDGEKKKRRKKKIQEKMSGENEEHSKATHPEEKKGFIEKIKEKLPGQHKKAEEGAAEHFGEGDDKEKKGEEEKAKHKEN